MKINLTIQMDDKPGELAKACIALGDLKVNIESVEHQRSDLGCFVKFELTIKDKKHEEQLKNTLEEKGFILISE